MRIPAAALNFVARNRFSIPIACGVAAIFIYVYQAEINPPPLESIELIDVEASAVGMLQINVMGRRDDVAVAQREAGYAIEYMPTNSASSPIRSQPVRMTFASELELTAPELKWIQGHGPSYRIGVLRGKVVSIASKTQPLIGYERYASSAAFKRDRWRVYGVLVLMLGGVAYAIGHRHHARTDA